jgi:uncharacterized protein YhbP (UPF0306 family)
MKMKATESAQMDKKISTYIKAQTALTMATCAEGMPYCATCFYAYIEEGNLLIFKSDAETKHISDALSNNQVAGSILVDKTEIGKIKGIQFNGTFITPKDAQLKDAQKAYYFKYPYAAAMKGDLWAIELTSVKFTDNTLGFGKKLIWEKNIESPY